MPLYDVAVMQLPTKAEAETGVQSKLILGPKSISAKDQNTAIYLAGRDLELPDGVNRDLLEIKARVWA